MTDCSESSPQSTPHALDPCKNYCAVTALCTACASMGPAQSTRSYVSIIIFLQSVALRSPYKEARHALAEGLQPNRARSPSFPTYSTSPQGGEGVHMLSSTTIVIIVVETGVCSSTAGSFRREIWGVVAGIQGLLLRIRSIISSNSNYDDDHHEIIIICPLLLRYCLFVCSSRQPCIIRCLANPKLARTTPNCQIP